MIILHQIATTYNQRPSQVMGIEDTWLAYDFDIAVMRTAQLVTDKKIKVGRGRAAVSADDVRRALG